MICIMVAWYQALTIVRGGNIFRKGVSRDQGRQVKAPVIEEWTGGKDGSTERVRIEHKCINKRMRAAIIPYRSHASSPILVPRVLV